MGLMTDDEIKVRITSPLNLMNRLREETINRKAVHPALPARIDDVVKDIDDKLNNGSIKSKASNILLSAMNELEKRMPEIQKPERLAAIAKDMSTVVDNQNKNGRKDNENDTPRIVIYAPQIRDEREFVTINVSE